MIVYSAATIYATESTRISSCYWWSVRIYVSPGIV